MSECNCCRCAFEMQNGVKENKLEIKKINKTNKVYIEILIIILI